MPIWSVISCTSTEAFKCVKKASIPCGNKRLGKWVCMIWQLYCGTRLLWRCFTAVWKTWAIHNQTSVHQCIFSASLFLLRFRVLCQTGILFSEILILNSMNTSDKMHFMTDAFPMEQAIMWGAFRMFSFPFPFFLSHPQFQQAWILTGNLPWCYLEVFL